MTDGPVTDGTREAAQERADQIAAFRAEIDQLTREGVAPFSAAALQRIAAHHDGLLRHLAEQFDIDRTTAARQMSRGMQIASFLGAAALVAAIVSFFSRIWGALEAAAQVALVTAAPLTAVAVMLVAGRLEKTRYVASLFAIVACGAFVLQTVLVGQLFNLRASPHVLAVWAVFALVVATPWRFGVPFAFGAIALAVYVPAALLWAAGVWWMDLPQRPELLGASSALGLLVLGRVPRDLAVWGRAVLLVIALAMLLSLSFGAESVLSQNQRVVEVIYQIACAVVAIALIAIGLRRGLDEVVTVGSLFGGIFLLTRFVDWWWAWMPKYLFFLMLAGVALAWIWGLRVARRRLAGAAP